MVEDLGLVIAVPDALPATPVGTLLAPVRLLRQLRAAGACGPAYLVRSEKRASTWGAVAHREDARAVAAGDVPAALSATCASTWLCAPGDLVLSGEGLVEAVAAARLGRRASLPNAEPVWEVAPGAVDGIRAWAASTCAGRETPPDGAAAHILEPQRYAGRVRDDAAAHQLNDAVMSNLGHAKDPNFARLTGRRISRAISRRLAAADVSPNAVTLAGTTAGIAAALCLLQGSYGSTLVGALLLVFSRLLDDCDGEVARMTIRQSDFGAKLDLLSDLVVHASVFGGMTLGLHRTDPTGGYLWALALLLVGAGITTVIVLGVVTGSALPEQSRLLRLLETGASGDFAYLFLLVALLGLTGVFLWAAAIGAQAYWLLLLVVIWRVRDSA